MVSDKAEFCPHCGTPVSEFGCTMSSITEEPSTVTYAATINVNTNDAVTLKQGDNNPNESKRKNVIRTIIAILFVVAIVSVTICICSIILADELETIELIHLEREREEQARLARKEQGISSMQLVDLGLSVCWAGWNIGANAPEEYGNHFAWGEVASKDEKYTSYTYKYVDGSDYKNIGSDICGTRYDVAHVLWGGDWRMPDKSEFQELLNECTWTWITCNGVDGYKVTGPNGKSIFLPAAGCLSNRESHKDGFGCYWSGTIYDNGYRYNDNDDCAYFLSFHIDGQMVLKKDRSIGHTVRPVCNK